MNAAFKAVMPPTEKLVLLRLCDHANDDGMAWPSVDRIAEAACISARQTKRVLKTLTEAGYIAIHGNEAGGRPGQTRIYRIDVQRFSAPLLRAKKAPAKGDILSPVEGCQDVTGDKMTRVTPAVGTGDTSGKGRVTPAVRTGDIAMSPEPPKNLKENHQRTTTFPAAENSATGADDETAFQAACRQTWAAYSASYLERYQTPPVRNAAVNSSVRTFVQRIGHDESPKVAEFYVWINDQYLIRNGHAFQLLLKSAEGYRTQWATGKAVTQTQARQIEKTASNKSAAEEAKAILRARQANGGAYRSAVAAEAIQLARQGGKA